MRDHTKLKAFQLADKLALGVYRATVTCPKEERFGLTFQIRRSAVSVASNIVEGCARKSEADYLHFLDIAYASSRELGYQLSLAFRLGFLQKEPYENLKNTSDECSKVLSGLIRSFRR
jgi:four helix bundle protein